jgi:DNA-binding GntR family transcriptional regulator
MHELAARAPLTEGDIEEMRAANRRFDTATRDGDVGAAMRADDDLHGVLVRACGNRAVAATVERYTPLVRRLEWQRFSERSARRSVELHDELIAACAAGDTDEAIRVTAEIWHSLEQLAEGDTSP